MKHFRPILPAIFFISIWLIFSWKFFFKGFVPAPLDFLVGFYGPWQSHYAIPIKNPAISDVVNQIIPWKIFTISQWKSGIVPLWNPYNFSGTPHAANWQSAVFYPANTLPIIFGIINGWSLYVMSQSLLAGLFTYLYCRSLKLSSASSLLSAMSFAFCGFMTSWFEWGTLGHAILWLPASLWAIEKFLSSHNTKYILLNTIFLALSLLAGHLQISLYVIAMSFAYFVYRWRKHVAWLAFLYSLSLLLIGFQLFPSIELYFNSVRGHAVDVGWFNYFRIPIEYLTTFIAPDFFGNPVTRNEWGRGSYVEMMGYIGIIPLVLALSQFRSYRRDPKSSNIPVFFTWVVVVGLIFGLKTPLANIITLLHIPIFATSSPARIIGLISFSLSILAGIGLDQAFKTRFKSLKYPSLLTGSVLVILWTISFILKLPVSQHNLILPTAMFIAFASLIYIGSKFKKSLLIVFCLLLIVIADLFRFHHKFTPYTSRQYWYPKLPVIEKLQQIQGNDRSFGLFDANLNLPFQIYSIEGYDSLFYASYAKLMSTQKNGEVNLPNRVSGAQLGKNEPHTIQILNQLGVKYIVQPTVHGSAPWELHLWEYPNQFKMIYDDRDHQILVNKLAYPTESTTTMTYRPVSFTIGVGTSALVLMTLLITAKKIKYVT